MAPRLGRAEKHFISTPHTRKRWPIRASGVRCAFDFGGTLASRIAGGHNRGDFDLSRPQFSG